MKRFFQYNTIVDLSILNREQRLRLEEELVLMRLQEVGYLISSLPKEIIDLIFKFCEANEEECLFKLGCISIQWNAIAKEVMREVYRNRMGRSDRILRLFTELTELMVGFSNNKLITDKSVSLLTNLTELNIRQNNGTVTGTSFSKLTKLQKLRLLNCSELKTDDIRSLSQLTELELIGGTRIDDTFAGSKKVVSFEKSGIALERSGIV
jgi:Leucine-rich repeat (LRR) protein